MESVRADIQKAYQAIRERIITLELEPGAPIKPRYEAEDLGVGIIPVKEALELLEHDGLVAITPRQEHGIHVTNVHLADLDQLSEIRLTLESRSARLAAERATSESLKEMESLRQEQARVPVEDAQRLFDLDHRFHQAVAQAAGNTYLENALERFYGLSQRLWYLALPYLDFLPAAVEEHLELVDAIRTGDADRAARIMHAHVEGFYNKVRAALTVKATVSYGSDVRTVVVEEDALLGGAIIATGLPLEQPCAGRGTCGKCKVLVEGGLSPPDEVELRQLSEAELAAGYRLACRAHLTGDATVTLAPVVVYSNKIFRACDDYKQEGVPLGLAIDLGSTTVAAFLTLLTDGQVCAGAAALNQQTVFGADVISRLAVADRGDEQARRLAALAKASIIQAVDALRLPRSARERVEKVTVVGNCAMHHLLLQYPVETLVALPFQPHGREAVRRPAGELLGDGFTARAEVAVPPLIGGFVGSDALACLVYYGFDQAQAPMAAIDLGTNGEVMVTDGQRILVASTAAGPAFEGVNISCGTRAVDGAIVGVEADETAGTLSIRTIGDHAPVGLTGSGLLDLVYELRRVGVIEASGRIADDHSTFGGRLDRSAAGVRRFLITERGLDLRGAESAEEAAQVSLYLTQHDIRELQKAKAAIRAATEVLMARLDLEAEDLTRMILTGSFGSQLSVEAVRGMGMIPAVDAEIVETSANGAGLGAAMMLDDDQFARGQRIAEEAEQVDLDLDARFNDLYIGSMMMPEVT
ncbi:MAG: ASKHA domain-containing protein [Anaerolineae bacterium]|jgi:uncharacterized 2Fe-2S/4Fe-4S cluster protein (DUF4445 family)/DNA-binding GntR family transcriptional regulator